MNKRLKFLLATLLLGVPLLFSGLATAIEGSDQAASGNEIKTETQMTEQEKAELRARFEQRKNSLKLRLSALDQQKFKLKCKAAQTPLGTLRAHGIDTRVKRGKIYDKLVERLTKLSTKVKAASVDTATLDSQIETLKAKIEAFKTDLTNYQQALTDLAGMDCAADPDAFKASLETARSLRAKLSQSGKDIKAYIKETIKPTLQNIRGQLEAIKESNEGDSL
jgi:hypothetical protein